MLKHTAALGVLNGPRPFERGPCGFADNNAGRELAGHLGETKYAPGVGQQGRMVAAKSSAAKSESASFSTLSEAIHFFRAPGMTDERE